MLSFSSPHQSRHHVSPRPQGRESKEVERAGVPLIALLLLGGNIRGWEERFLVLYHCCPPSTPHSTPQQSPKLQTNLWFSILLRSLGFRIGPSFVQRRDRTSEGSTNLLQVIQLRGGRLRFNQVVITQDVSPLFLLGHRTELEATRFTQPRAWDLRTVPLGWETDCPAWTWVERRAGLSQQVEGAVLR